MDIMLVCPNCDGIRDVEVFQSKGMKSKHDFTCLDCGQKWVEFIGAIGRNELRCAAIEQALFGVSFNDEWDIEKLSRMVDEIRRLNRIEQRSEDYLKAVKGPNVTNAYDHWTRKIVLHVIGRSENKGAEGSNGQDGFKGFYGNNENGKSSQIEY